MIKNIAAALSVVALFSGAASAASCKEPKYITHGRAKGDNIGPAIASALLLPGTAILALVGQPLRLVPGGKKHAENVLCVPKAQLKSVGSAVGY